MSFKLDEIKLDEIKLKNNIQKKDYILLIFNCVKYKDKALKQKNTWLKELSSIKNKDNIIYFHVIGNPDLDQDFLINVEQQTLLIKVADDYNSLPKKVIQAYEAIINSFQFKYIFKTDDDQMLSPVKFLDTLITVLENKYTDPVLINRVHYGGFIVDVKREHVSQYFKFHPELPSDLLIKKTQYCSGRFYLLSHEVTVALLLKKEEISKEFLEDYAIGIHMPSQGFKDKIMNIDTSMYFKDFVE
jgi:hypothetical protein